MFDMRRRAVITLLGGAAAWPLTARAQQQKFFHLGYLEAGAASDRTVQDLRRQFLLGLRDLGYIEGRHFKLEERYAATAKAIGVDVDPTILTRADELIE